ncbi:MAG: nitroreductase family deazaflavin-dependent oxidoreductase [Acidimicrobiia bacterium]
MPSNKPAARTAPAAPAAPAPTSGPIAPGAHRYLRPGRPTRHLLNPLVAGLTRLGLSVRGSRVLEVTGRRSGRARRTPVNVLELGGQRYLVAPRGTTEWVRNIRSAGRCALLLGRRREELLAVELPDAEKVPVLRAYLQRWRAEVGAFFDGIGPDAPDHALRAVAAGYPVFRLQPVAGRTGGTVTAI